MVLGGITDQTFSESEVRWRDSVMLSSSEEFNMMVLQHPHARVGGVEIDSNSMTISISGHGEQIRQGEVGCGVLWLHR